RLANWLAVLNFREIQKETSRKRTPQTGYWVLEMEIFKAWVRGSEGGPRIIWGTGMPGAGKTVIASLVIEHLQKIAKEDPGVCVAFAYCRYTERIPVRVILAALLRQILERYPSVFPFVQSLNGQHHLERTEPDQEDILDVLRQISTSGLFKTTFYVLDGLDEASTAVRFDLLEALASLPVRFLLTSRPLESLEDQVPDAEFFNISASDADIALLIDQKINRIPALRRLLRQNESIKGRRWYPNAELVSRFLLASLQMDMLQASECPSIKDLWDCFARLPAGIDAMYEMTMKRIESQPSNKLAKLALTWLAFGEEALSVDQLRYAVAVDLETYKFDADRLVDKDYLLSSCCGLIAVESDLLNGLKFRLIHFTARDYLKLYLAAHWSPCSPRSIIASACIARLLQYNFHDFQPQADGHGSRIIAQSDAYEEDVMLRYAHTNWANHARQCTPFPDDVLDFIGQCRQYLLGFSELGRDVHVAAAYGVEEYFVAEFLLTAAGIDVHVRDSNGWTALIAAADKGMESVVRRLLTLESVEVNAKTRIDCRTALIRAAFGGHESTIRLLCKAPGMDINATDDKGETILTAASRACSDSGAIRALLNFPGIDVNAGSASALAIAVCRNEKAIAMVLLQFPGIDVNKEFEGDTALGWAAAGKDIGMLEMLLNHPGIDVNAGSDKPLIVAAREGRLDIVKRLLGHPGIEVNAEDTEGYTAL
ncbi:ankyrin, partial [Coprinopsis marcescibilis]